MAGMDHSRMPGMGTAPAARPAPAGRATATQPRTPPAMAGMDHANTPGMNMVQPARMAAPPPTPERPATVAAPGQPATTLRPDEIDSPAPTAVREAARSAAMAMEMAGGGGHGMQHGTYRQIDAGRDDVTPPPQGGHEGHQAAPTTPDPHSMHAAPASPKPAAKPSPRPTPSPRPKEDNR